LNFSNQNDGQAEMSWAPIGHGPDEGVWAFFIFLRPTRAYGRLPTRGWPKVISKVSLG